MVAFGGWRMPLEYAGSLKEHLAVRERVGLFDVSHLGKVEVSGAGALEVLQRTLSNDLERVGIGQAQYNLVLDDDAGIVDDLIVYRIDERRYLVVPNASNTATVLRMLTERRGSARVTPLDGMCVLAVQGPDATRVTGALFAEAPSLGYMGCLVSTFSGVEAVVARSGYTGELGYEVFIPREAASELWRALLDGMDPYRGEPCGLAARDVLRLEMGYPLHGQDLSVDTTPLEAGLMWAVALEKAELTGRSALIRMREGGAPSHLRGLRMLERRHIPRAHCRILLGGRPIGDVTSGTFSPLLQVGIGLAYLRPAGVADIGDRVEVEIRGRRGVAEVVRPPFVDRSPR